MRDRVRQMWSPDTEHGGGRWQAQWQQVQRWYRSSTVQERVSLLKLQTVVASVLVVVVAGLRALPWQGLQPVQSWVSAVLSRDITVTEMTQNAAAWANHHGGWRRVLLDTRQGLGQQARRVLALLPGGAPAEVEPGPPATAAGRRPAPAVSAVPPPVAPAAPQPAASAVPPPAAPGLERPVTQAPTAETPAPAPATVIVVQRGDETAGLSQTGADQPRVEAGQSPAAAEPERVRPVPGAVLSPFGWRTRQGQEQELHEGVDLAAPPGTAVRAMMAGTVRSVGQDSRLGLYIELDHGDGYVSRYAPLAEAGATVGDRVPAGALLGQLGPAPPGEPDQPHLHLSLSKDGRAVDPLPFLGREDGI